MSSLFSIKLESNSNFSFFVSEDFKILSFLISTSDFETSIPFASEFLKDIS